VTLASAAIPIGSARTPVARATLTERDGRRVALFSLSGGKHHGSIGTAEGATIESLVDVAVSVGAPILGVLDTSGAEIFEGVAALHAWGRVARALTRASGVVPVLLGVTGAALSGPSLLLGLADHVVMCEGSFAYVTGPADVEAFTGVHVDRVGLGGPAVHARRSGLATLTVEAEADVLLALELLLSYLPDHHLADPKRIPSGDPADRLTRAAVEAVPADPHASYDVRAVITDVLDDESWLELHPWHATSSVVGYGRLDGRVVGIVANQPFDRAGTIGIDAARKAARFVQLCDSFNLPIITFVDTPGFTPGRDLEWRGIIRHGAQLVHAYAAATVPRLSIVLRKNYGGGYIVMDSRALGNDWCAAWPLAEIAVVGARGAVEILQRRRLLDAAPAERDRVRDELEAEFTERFANPYEAAARGYVDEVIDPIETRRALAGALDRLHTKREAPIRRRHSNTPL
jgi:acetyl-CoA carboxylase carboxyltransferase component